MQWAVQANRRVVGVAQVQRLVLVESSSTLDLRLEYGTGVPGRGAVRVRVSQPECTVIAHTQSLFFK
jgi:hypothetical protein